MGEYSDKITPSLLTGGMLGDAVLGSGSGHALAQQLAAAINTPNSTVYDKAIDSVYLSTHTGGSQLHHLVDGQHDIFGAFEAAARALPGDSLWQEVMGTAQHLGKDLFSVSGLPVVSLEPGKFQAMSGWLQAHLHVPGRWLGDLLQINGLELFSGMLSVAAVVLGCKQADAQRLAELSAASGLAGMLTANPIGLCSAVIALVLAWKQKGASPELGKSLLVGAGSAGAALVAGSGVTALGGGLLPALGGLILSVVVGMYVRRFLLKFLGVAADTPVQLREAHESLPEWKMPHMSPVEVEVWREMLNYPYQVDDDVRRMLQKALRD